MVVHHLNDPERADALVAELAQGGARAFAVGGDLTEEAAVEQMFHQITEQFGGCTVVVHGDNGVTIDGVAHATGARVRWQPGQKLVLGDASPAAVACTLELTPPPGA